MPRGTRLVTTHPHPLTPTAQPGFFLFTFVALLQPSGGEWVTKWRQKYHIDQSIDNLRLEKTDSENLTYDINFADLTSKIEYFRKISNYVSKL